MKKFILHVFWYVYAILGSILFGFICLPALLGPQKWSAWLAGVWTGNFLRSMKWFLNIDYKIHGLENIPQKGSFIIACKHQSTWETFIFSAQFKNPVFFIKRSLLYIPMLGWFFKKLRMIVVDRSKSSAGSFLKKAAQEVALDRAIIIFPEGTRVAVGAHQAYHRGVYALDKALDIPVIPVALNSGIFWPRRTFLKNPGTIEMTLLPPLPKGLSKDGFMQELEKKIESQTRLLEKKSHITSFSFACWVRSLGLSLCIFLAALSVFPGLSDTFVRQTFLGYYWVKALDHFNMRSSAPPLRPEYAQSIHQLLKDISCVLKTCRILYWIDGGTLLGAVRHKGFIPWDDDADLQINDQDRILFEKKAVPILRKLGYGISPLSKDCGVSICCSAAQWKREHDYETPPACDIFFAKKNAQNFYSLKGYRSALKHEEIFPLHAYVFGPLVLMGPAAPERYLRDLYGKNWQLIGKRGTDHLTVDGREKSRRYFLIKNPYPLLPNRRLIHNEKIIQQMFEKG